MTTEQHIDELCRQCFNNAKEKGFWHDFLATPQTEISDRTFISERFALIHSEISEALEYHRDGNPKDDKIPTFSGIEAELADACIRIFDLAGGMNYKLGAAIVAKMEYNKGRGHKHGRQA